MLDELSCASRSKVTSKTMRELGSQRVPSAPCEFPQVTPAEGLLCNIVVEVACVNRKFFSLLQPSSESVCKLGVKSSPDINLCVPMVWPLICTSGRIQWHTQNKYFILALYPFQHNWCFQIILFPCDSCRTCSRLWLSVVIELNAVTTAKVKCPSHLNPLSGTEVHSFQIKSLKPICNKNEQ